MAIGTRAFQETSHDHATFPRTLSLKAGLTWRSLYCTNALRQICLPVRAALEFKGLGGAGVGAAGSTHLTESRDGSSGLIGGGREGFGRVVLITV
jgi:hypothetical protein